MLSGDAAAKDDPMPESRFRIVSLVPSLTDLCFSMNLGKLLVGRTDFCIAPAGRVEAIPPMGGPKSVDPARLAAARPTHVLISPEENGREAPPLIAACGAEAVMVHPLSAADNRDIFARFGEIFDRREEAAMLSARLDAALERAARCRARTPRLTALPLIWSDPWITVGSGTYAAAMLDAVGIRAMPPEDGLYPRIADLSTAAKNADWLLLTSEPYPFTEAHVAALRKELGRSSVARISGEAVAWYGSHAIAALDELVAVKLMLLDNPVGPPQIQTKTDGER
jgi:ABC-type Fe3+-hydroxamate transport system substrate-binding protein